MKSNTLTDKDYQELQFHRAFYDLCDVIDNNVIDVSELLAKEKKFDAVFTVFYDVWTRKHK